MTDSSRVAAIAALAIFAVAVVAATIQSTVRPESSGPRGSGSGSGGGSGGWSPPQAESPPGEVVQIPFLEELLAVLVVLVVLAVLAYLYRYWREGLTALLVLAGVLGVLAIIMTLLGSPGDQPIPPALEPGSGGPLGGGGGGGSESADRPSLPAVLLLLVLVAALFGTIVAYRATSPTEDETAEPDDARQRAVDTSAVGEAAGRAADRLEESASVDNEVYRAWREMTEFLDVPDPETSTPAEFANAAVAAGMSEDDVRELTRLFEDVRYGDAAPSAERERRAVEIFRRIEDQYTEDAS